MATSTTNATYNLSERGGDMVTITTHDGKVYTDPSQVKVLRNEKMEMFYRFLENFVPQQKEDSA